MAVVALIAERERVREREREECGCSGSDRRERESLSSRYVLDDCLKYCVQHGLSCRINIVDPCDQRVHS